MFNTIRQNSAYKKRTKVIDHKREQICKMRGSTAGLAEGTIVTPDTVHAAFLMFLDVMFSSVIAAPVVIAYWRGTWNLMRIVLFPNNTLKSAISSMLIGTFGHFFFNYYQGKFSKSFHPDKHRITYMIISRMYTAIYGVVCVNGWRGGWTLLDLYVPKNVPTYFAILMISCTLLAFCKGLRNITGAPFILSTDHSKHYFTVPTMFKASVSYWGEHPPLNSLSLVYILAKKSNNKFLNCCHTIKFSN